MSAKFPNHKIPGKALLEIFYRALDPLNQLALNNAEKGPLLNLHFQVAIKFLRKVTKHNRECHTHYLNISIRFPITPLTNRDLRIWEEDEEWILEKILAQHEVLTIYFMGGTANTTSHKPPKSHYKDEWARRMKEENLHLANHSGGGGLFWPMIVKMGIKVEKIVMLIKLRESGNISVIILYPTTIGVQTKSKAELTLTEV